MVNFSLTVKLRQLELSEFQVLTIESASHGPKHAHVSRAQVEAARQMFDLDWRDARQVRRHARLRHDAQRQPGCLRDVQRPA